MPSQVMLGVDELGIIGRPIPRSFTAQPGRCFRMVYSEQLQSTHCYEAPAWKGIWKDRKGRSWYVEACAEHAPKLRRPSPSAA
jgi:hypothetical protein